MGIGKIASLSFVYMPLLSNPICRVPFFVGSVYKISSRSSKENSKDL
jgi:hypothetical protein